MKHICKIFIFYFLGIFLGFSQDNFNSHVVVKGDNVYRISLKYNVSMNAIYEHNPGSENVITIGQTLKIPTSTTSSQNSQINNKDEYLVVKGDTKYGLSKRYNITIRQLETENPQIINGLQAGHRLKLPQLSDKQQSNTYLVKKGDTKWSLSKRFGMSIAEFEEINPNTVPVLKSGDLISTSNNNSATVINQSVATTDSKNPEEPQSIPPSSNAESTSEFIDYTIKPKETLYGLSKKAGMSINEFLKLNPQLEESVLVGTIIKMPNIDGISSLPSEKKPKLVTSSPKRNISTQIIWKDNTDIANNNFSSVESYKIGMQMAIDSIKKLIPNIKLDLTDYSNSYTSNQSSSSSLNSHFIITPFSLKTEDKEQLDYLSISTFNNGEEKTINYKGLVDESEMQKSIIKYLNKEEANTILIYDKDKDDTKEFVESQIANLKTTRVNRKGVFKSQELIDHLNSNIKNYVIIESSRDGVFLSATNILLKQLANYNIELVVLNPKYIPEENKVSSKRFRILKLIYPSCFSSEFYRDKKSLLNNYFENTSQNVSNDIAFGFGMMYNALFQIYYSEDDSFRKNSSNVFGIPLHFDEKNEQFSNKTVFIYRYDEKSDTYLLETY
ncbi:LysM peptidoglycan-binding domain-containing protein [Xanthomarina sp. F1114]|uniref:LysM peptidoglycan-binding domain-containing protein n=1 Tax=Xanthomarina sp. F1114 TaxID=2996019 RepID=UPI00225E5559|nr:LysM peptidoglycan-binding domain-containing protein [Xanthomarina sp. F1114]MCX7547648.1 LysM peptidoglycan-binding domain-containing protein [Xanthomarina sp. F1114]